MSMKLVQRGVTLAIGAAIIAVTFSACHTVAGVDSDIESTDSNMCVIAQATEPAFVAPVYAPPPQSIAPQQPSTAQTPAAQTTVTQTVQPASRPMMLVPAPGKPMSALQRAPVQQIATPQAITGPPAP